MLSQTKTNSIVLVFIICGIACLAGLTTVVLINNKTFVDKVYYRTVVDNAKGLSAKPPILFKGIEIGQIKSFELNDKTNEIEVSFFVYANYQTKVLPFAILASNQNVLLNEPSEYELIIPKSPPNREPLAAGSLVPYISSDIAQQYIRGGIIEKQGNSVDSIIASVNKLLEGFQKNANPEDGALFDILYKVSAITEQLLAFSHSLNNEQLIANSSQLIKSINQVVAELPKSQQRLEALLSMIDKLTNTLNKTVADYQSPNEIIKTATGDQVPKLLTNVNETIQLVKAMTEEIHAERMQLAVTVNTLLKVLNRADSTLQGVNNNPLIRGGIDSDIATPNAIEMAH